MNKISYESPAAMNYINVLQGIITRMAANSSSCKTWCVTLVSAIIVIVADKGKPEFIIITVIPIILFLFLDSYYLGLEKLFRTRYDDFVEKLHANETTINDLFIAKPGSHKDIFKSVSKSIRSFAVWPFYGLLGLMLLIVRTIIFPCR